MFSAMALDDIPLISMLKSRLGYLNQQQRSVAMNVANSDTPGYTPKDLQSFAYRVQAQGAGAGIGGALPLAPIQTNSAHIATIAIQPTTQTWKTQSAPDSETRLDGNQVVLEEEMMKMGKARGDYTAAITFYEKSLSLIQLALRTPGKPS